MTPRDGGSVFVLWTGGEKGRRSILIPHTQAAGIGCGVAYLSGSDLNGDGWTLWIATWRDYARLRVLFDGGNPDPPPRTD